MMKFIIGFVVLAMALLSAQSWAATDLTQGLRETNFPVRVEAITFSSGNTIGGGRAVCWGQWCAHFESETAVATWRQNAGSAQAVDIENLACKNDVLGTRPCTIILFVKSGRPFACIVSFPNSDELTSFDIQCPVSLR